MENIFKFIDQHVAYNRGYDIKQGPFPLPASIGEGFRFIKKDHFTGEELEFIAEADRKYGKRELKFQISTFVGMCAGACHFFCRAHSYIHLHEVGNSCHIIGGYLGGIKLPRESEDLQFEIGIPLTQQMIEYDMGHYRYSKVGDCGTALRSKEEFYEIIKELENVFDMNEWKFVVDDNC